MRNAAKFALLESTVVVLLTVGIVAGYVVVMPRWSPDLRTYAVFALGLLLAGLIGGYVAHSLATRGRRMHWVRVLAMGGLVTAVTALLSLFLMLNMRGS